MCARTCSRYYAGRQAGLGRAAGRRLVGGAGAPRQPGRPGVGQGGVKLGQSRWRGGSPFALFRQVAASLQATCGREGGKGGGEVEEEGALRPWLAPCSVVVEQCMIHAYPVKHHNNNCTHSNYGVHMGRNMRGAMSPGGQGRYTPSATPASPLHLPGTSSSKGGLGAREPPGRGLSRSASRPCSRPPRPPLRPCPRDGRGRAIRDTPSRPPGARRAREDWGGRRSWLLANMPAESHPPWTRAP